MTLYVLSRSCLKKSLSACIMCREESLSHLVLEVKWGYYKYDVHSFGADWPKQSREKESTMKLILLFRTVNVAGDPF